MISHWMASHSAAPVCPQAEADGHGPGKEEDDVPGNVLQVVDVQDLEDEEEDGGAQGQGRLVQEGQARVKHLEAQDKDQRAHYDQGQDFVPGHGAQLAAESLGLFLEPGGWSFSRV